MHHAGIRPTNDTGEFEIVFQGYDNVVVDSSRRATVGVIIYRVCDITWD